MDEYKGPSAILGFRGGQRETALILKCTWSWSCSFAQLYK